MKIFEVLDKQIIAYHVTPERNLRKIKKIGLVPQIGTNSSSYGETEGRIYLFPTSVDADNAVMNWLGDLYDEDEQLALLAVDIAGLPTKKDVGWELNTNQAIPPERIKIISTDF